MADEEDQLDFNEDIADIDEELVEEELKADENSGQQRELAKEKRALEFLNLHHPECKLDYREEILQKLQVSTYPPDNGIDKKHKSVPYLTIFEKTKNNISNNKSMFHKTELTENIFNHSSVSLKKLNAFLSEKDPKAKTKKDREISDTLETIKSAIYRHNGTSNPNKINTQSFEIIARNMLTNSTAQHSKQDLMNIKNDIPH
jgi:hypothetical protein